MKPNRKYILIFLMFAFAGGCAGKAGIFPLETTKSGNDSLVQAYLEKGREFESKGDLVEARKQYSLALTANPPSARRRSK